MEDKKNKRNCPCDNNMDNNMLISENNPDGNDFKKEKVLMEIRELNFSIVELGLYLDTHPEDQRALCLHKKYVKELKELKDKYQKVYGPLSIYFPCNKWRWLEEPWPWERGNY